MGAGSSLNGYGAMVHQNPVGRADMAVGTSIYGQLVAADPDIGVPAGHEVEVVLPVRTGHVFGGRNARPVTIGHDDGVSTHLRFDASEQQVVGLAATGKRQQQRSEGEEPGVHVGSVMYFAV